jgi:hypothetical protein
MSKEEYDILLKIFDRHLYEYSYEDQETFLDNVIDEYVTLLGAPPNIVVNPDKLREEMREEVGEMLLKKMYGCLPMGGKEDSSDGHAGKSHGKRGSK